MNDLSRSQSNRAAGPFQDVFSSVFSSTVRENPPFRNANSLRVNGDDDALASKLLSPFGDQFGRGKRGRVNADFVGARLQHQAYVLQSSDAAARRKRHKTLIRRTFHDVHHRPPAVSAGGNIKKHHLVGALLIILDSQLDRIAHVLKFARLGSSKLNAAGNPSVMDV